MSENVTATSQFANVGSELRISREKAGLSLEDVSAQLRISVRHLENIESGERDRLPGSTYLLGFVRSYAKLLKLNADDICQRIMDAMTEADFKPELHIVGGGVNPTDYRTRYIMAGVVLLILAYSGWYLLRSETISTSGFLSVEESGEEAETPSISDEVAAGVTIIPETLSETASQEAVENVQVGFDTPQDDPQIETISSDADTDDVSANDNASPQMMIKATNSTWIELKTEAEETVVAKLLLADEMINIPDDGVYTLTTGNAGGLLIGYQGDDASWKTLGDNGEILKMKAIDNSLLQD
jgi:cytoskeleton protein RodZ